MNSRVILFFMFAIAALIIWVGSARAGDLPNPTLTPGALNPAVTQANIKQNICIPNWTTTVRPPTGYTNKLKVQQMAQYGIPANPKLYEEDHLIALSLGGSPTDPHNLWPQPWDGMWGAHRKDQLEVKLHKLVCAGTIPLAEAQHAIATDWVAAYGKYVGKVTK